jgi:histidyl-tRNA synthetase
LIGYFEQHADRLDEDAKRRLHSNPLRILDTKNPAMQALVEAAPQLMDFLGEASLAHLASVQAALDAVGQAYTLNPRLVRGMDYYNLTVFEWVTDRLGAQGTVCGGGRYDGLIEQIGGKAAPAVGWGMGIERVLALLEDSGLALPADVPDAYAVVPDPVAMPVAMAVLDQLRAHGVRVLMHAAGKEGQGSFKSQFKKADASGARFALIFGADELAQGCVALKPLREQGASQSLQLLDDVNAWVGLLQSVSADA